MLQPKVSEPHRPASTRTAGTSYATRRVPHPPRTSHPHFVVATEEFSSSTASEHVDSSLRTPSTSRHREVLHELHAPRSLWAPQASLCFVAHHELRELHELRAPSSTTAPPRLRRPAAARRCRRPSQTAQPLPLLHLPRPPALSSPPPPPLSRPPPPHSRRSCRSAGSAIGARTGSRSCHLCCGSSSRRHCRRCRPLAARRGFSCRCP